jgi:hypothetical protein
MGDKFENISHSTIINRSHLTNALNQVTADYGKEAEKAIKLVADHIAEYDSKEATDLFNSFNEEIAKGNANKTVLRALWDGIVKVLPDAAQVASAVTTISKMLV